MSLNHYQVLDSPSKDCLTPTGYSLWSRWDAISFAKPEEACADYLKPHDPLMVVLPLHQAESASL
jgi:hypothetical protein